MALAASDPLPKGRVKPRSKSPLIWREDLPNLTLFSTRCVERRDLGAFLLRLAGGFRIRRL